ncbi:MAG: FAD-dependent oxidoreductase, partial [Verrucomicrobiales bacterium]
MILRLLAALFFVLNPLPSHAATLESDICVYGGTSGGVVAAVQAARMGKSVVLLEPRKHLGGMTSGGLSDPVWGPVWKDMT